MARLRIGIVGANWGALAHLPAWRTLPDDVEVTAICTSRRETAEAAARTYGVDRAFWDYAAMVADPDIDIVDVGTGPLLREKIVGVALNAGKHVVNQMPFATSYDMAAGLEALRAANGVQGVAAAALMGLPHLTLMKEMIDAGQIGEVFQVNCSWQMGFFLDIMPGFPYTWFGKAGLGVGVARNHGSHILPALRHLFGPIASLSAHLRTQLKTWDIPGEGLMTVETDDTAHVLLAFENGAMGTVSTSWIAADSPGFSLDAMGSKGRLHLTALAYPNIESATLYAAMPGMTMAPAGTTVMVPERLMRVGGVPHVAVPSDQISSHQRIALARLFESLVGAVRGTCEPLLSFARATEMQGVIEAIHLSSERRTWVDTPAPRV